MTYLLRMGDMFVLAAVKLSLCSCQSIIFIMMALRKENQENTVEAVLRSIFGFTKTNVLRDTKFCV